MTDAVDGPEAGREGVVITREALRDGSLLATLRRRAPPDMTIRSDAELDASLDEALAGRDPAGDAWVFGYGSLMWNPAFAFRAAPGPAAWLAPPLLPVAAHGPRHPVLSGADAGA